MLATLVPLGPLGLALPQWGVHAWFMSQSASLGPDLPSTMLLTLCWLTIAFRNSPPWQAVPQTATRNVPCPVPFDAALLRFGFQFYKACEKWEAEKMADLRWQMCVLPKLWWRAGMIFKLKHLYLAFDHLWCLDPMALGIVVSYCTIHLSWTNQNLPLFHSCYLTAEKNVFYERLG